MRRAGTLSSDAPAVAADAALTVTGLRRTFGRRDAVTGLDLSCAAGTVTGLLGPNGCGKSTTMKLLAGALTASAGTITFGGVPAGVGGLTVQAVTGFIPDVGGLFPRLSGWEHLELAGRLYGVRDWSGRSAALLARLDLLDAAGERAGEYSHGMSRKLSAAIALLAGPRLLLADEPFDGVDQAGIDALTGLLRERAAAGAVVLVTTHLLSVAESLCDDVHLMRAGSLVASGPAGSWPGGLPAAYTRVLGSAREDAGR